MRLTAEFRGGGERRADLGGLGLERFELVGGGAVGFTAEAPRLYGLLGGDLLDVGWPVVRRLEGLGGGATAWRAHRGATKVGYPSGRGGSPVGAWGMNAEIRRPRRGSRGAWGGRSILETAEARYRSPFSRGCSSRDASGTPLTRSPRSRPRWPKRAGRRLSLPRALFLGRGELVRTASRGFSRQTHAWPDGPVRVPFEDPAPGLVHGPAPGLVLVPARGLVQARARTNCW